MGLVGICKAPGGNLLRPGKDRNAVTTDCRVFGATLVVGQATRRSLFTKFHIERGLEMPGKTKPTHPFCAFLRIVSEVGCGARSAGFEDVRDQ